MTLQRAQAVVGYLALAAACSTKPEVDKNTALTPAAHATLFPIDVAGGVHSLPSIIAQCTSAGLADCNGGCDACHGGVDSFQQYTCTSSFCHTQAQTDPAHGQIVPGIELAPGYVFTPDGGLPGINCYQCHPAGVVQPGVNCIDGGLLLDGGTEQGGCFDHNAFFPIRPGGLHDGCSQSAVKAAVDAHQPQHSFSGDSNGQDPWLLTAGSGLTCPPFPDEGGVRCMDCHPDPTNHKALGCLLCHATPGSNFMHDAGLGGPGNWADDSTCFACHRQGAIGL